MLTVLVRIFWLLVAGCFAAPPYPFQDPSLPWSQRVDDLVSRLTLEEVYPQTLATYGGHTPAVPRLGIKPYVWISECLRGQVNTNGTTFPQALGLSASFSTELLYNVSEATAIEARAHWNANNKAGVYSTFYGLSCFSPVINIMRHPLWGRNQETYGEDPYMSGVLATAFVTGLQGSHPRYVRANAGCKHFDVHAGPENIPVSRSSFNAVVSMRDWRMTFLPQFKACVEAGTFSLMCSYNRINGIPSCANRQLLTDITRKEWGFKGYIVSDAGAVSNIITQQHYLNNSVDTAAACVKAGCNLELGSKIFLSQADALKQGKLTEEEVRENIKPLMMTRMRLGEFDPPSMNPYNNIDMSVIQSPEHRELAIRAATMSYVLLKNSNNFLPLIKKFENIAVVGPMADNIQQLFGDYSPQVNNMYTKTPRQALAALANNVKYGAGCTDVRCTDYDSSQIIQAVGGTDAVFICLGTGQELESEGNDRSSLDLPGSQLKLLQDAVMNANSAGNNIVLLLFNAGPLDVSWAVDSSRVSSIIECFFPGQPTGDALVRMLTMADTASNPAARLPATWHASMSQVPDITNYTMVDRTYRYWSWSSPLFPFGYGLSYTSFMYSDLSVYPKQIKAGDSVSVTFTVTSLGPYDGDEVSQVYMSWCNATVPVPVLQLAGFRRTFLKSKQSKDITLTITSEQMAVWNDDIHVHGFLVQPGMMTVYAGGQQPNQKVNVGSNVLKSSFIVT